MTLLEHDLLYFDLAPVKGSKECLGSLRNVCVCDLGSSMVFLLLDMTVVDDLFMETLRLVEATLMGEKVQSLSRS